MTGTLWAVLPPIIAIVMALLTKEVYTSLFLGVIIGCLMFTGFNPIAAIETCFEIMTGAIGDNAYILIFLVLLGIVVSLITKSGASAAYGEWASEKIKSRRASLLATSALGCLIFVDDYFNCLTVGTVMKPVTDKYNVSRAKLAYIIDATAAPVCILAPISSWAAAVSSSLPENCGIDGFALFLTTIPFNFYALFTLMFIVWIMWLDKDFFAMKKYEERVAVEGEKIIGEDMEIVGNGKVIDLFFPILTLIILCMTAMLYTGGILEGANIIDAFANCAAAESLVLGTFIALVLTFVFYVPRKILTFTQFADSIVEGMKSMCSAVIILCLAWSLSGICSADYLALGAYVSGFVKNAGALVNLMPLIFFWVSLGLSFATGTSWGSFGILIPIVVAIFPTEGAMLSMTVAACLAGSVAGDHMSPISDTTILSSAGAQCEHINHVSTQIPYAMCVVTIGSIAYVVGGFTGSGWLALGVGIAILIAFASFMTFKLRKEN